MVKHLCAQIQYPVYDKNENMMGYAHSDVCGYGDAGHREILHKLLDEFLDNYDDPDNGFFYVGNPWMDDYPEYENRREREIRKIVEDYPND